MGLSAYSFTDQERTRMKIPRLPKRKEDPERRKNQVKTQQLRLVFFLEYGSLLSHEKSPDGSIVLILTSMPPTVKIVGAEPILQPFLCKLIVLF